MTLTNASLGNKHRHNYKTSMPEYEEEEKIQECSCPLLDL